jgi:hypothetical protein
LGRLEAAGLVTLTLEHRRKIYSLTESGAERLKQDWFPHVNARSTEIEAIIRIGWIAFTKAGPDIARAYFINAAEQRSLMAADEEKHLEAEYPSDFSKPEGHLWLRRKITLASLRAEAQALTEAAELLNTAVGEAEKLKRS